MIAVDVTCDGCMQDIDIDETTDLYCNKCWLDVIGILPTVERNLRELAETLSGAAAKRVEALADHIYDMNTTPQKEP